MLFSFIKNKKEVIIIKISFSVPGEPVGKGRPRFVRTYRGGRAVTPEKTRWYEEVVRMEYCWQCRAKFIDTDMLKMHIDAYFGIPKSTSKKKMKEMLEKNIRPTKKPDADNIIKAIADALNGVAYYDDKQIVDCSISKYYSDEPRVEVFISNL